MRAALAVVALAGCATVAPEPRVAFESAPATSVPIPVVATCVDVAQIPPERSSSIPARGADVARLAAGASADVRQLRLDNAKLRAMLLACASK